MSEPRLLAGAARRQITPALDRGPVFLAGFQGDRRATGVDLELYVRALALRLDDEVAVIAAVDLIGLGLDEVERIRAALAPHGIPGERLIVACTHTHSGPDTLGLWGPSPEQSGRDTAYIARVRQAIVDAAVEALTFCCPVRLRAASAQLPGYIRNHRDPEIVDDQLGALQLVKPDGEVVATLLGLACHPEVLDGASTLLSADYAGAACAHVEAAAGGVALHISGALGGMLSPAIADRTPAGVRQMGAAYAEAALAALAGAEPATVEQLLLRRARLQLPNENPLFLHAMAAGLLSARPIADGAFTTEIAYLDLGPAQILTIPGELLPRLGFELKRAMPGPTRLLAGLADDEIGYILPDDVFVTPSDFLSPGAQYEESMSLGPTTGSRVVAAALALVGGAAT